MTDISLKLLKPDEAEAAGRIVGVAHSSYQELGPFYGEWWLKELFIPALCKEIEEGNLIVGGETSSGLVAVYELPNFLRTGNALENLPGSFGWFATREHNRGIGTAFMGRLEKVFAQSAFQAGVGRLIHREQATNSANQAFFAKQGYSVVGTGEAGRYTLRYCVKEVPASLQTLSELEQKIVHQVLSRAQHQQTI